VISFIMLYALHKLNQECEHLGVVRLLTKHSHGMRTDSGLYQGCREHLQRLLHSGHLPLIHCVQSDFGFLHVVYESQAVPLAGWHGQPQSCLTCSLCDKCQMQCLGYSSAKSTQAAASSTGFAIRPHTCETSQLTDRKKGTMVCG
jgi:hypothetical protein